MESGEGPQGMSELPVQEGERGVCLLEQGSYVRRRTGGLGSRPKSAGEYHPAWGVGRGGMSRVRWRGLGQADWGAQDTSFLTLEKVSLHSSISARQ